jgi:hypothetical protein
MQSKAAILCNPFKVDLRLFPFPRVRSATLGFVVEPLRGLGLTFRQLLHLALEHKKVGL